MRATDSLAALVALALAGACGRSSAPARAPETHRITIHAMAYDPAELTVRAGDTVEWTNADLVPHTATAAGDAAGAGAFDSTAIAPSARWQRTFTARGDVDYGCTMHPTMHASLHVR